MSPSSNGELRPAVYHRQLESEKRREQGGDIGRAMKIERFVNERERNRGRQETVEANRTSSRQRICKVVERRIKEERQRGKSDSYIIEGFCVSECKKAVSHNLQRSRHLLPIMVPLSNKAYFKYSTNCNKWLYKISKLLLILYT